MFQFSACLLFISTLRLKKMDTENNVNFDAICLLIYIPSLIMFGTGTGKCTRAVHVLWRP